MTLLSYFILCGVVQLILFILIAYDLFVIDEEFELGDLAIKIWVVLFLPMWAYLLCIPLMLICCLAPAFILAVALKEIKKLSTSKVEGG